MRFGEWGGGRREVRGGKEISEGYKRFLGARSTEATRMRNPAFNNTTTATANIKGTQLEATNTEALSVACRTGPYVRSQPVIA